MARLPLLESFDAREGPIHEARELLPSSDWIDGHAQGLADGQAEAAAAQTALSAEIVQTLADLAFGYAEARTHILQGLKPLFAAMINRILPGLAEAAFATQLIRMLQDVAERDSALPAELSVNPARIDGLTALLPFAVGAPVVLVADPAIGIDQAVLRSGRAETALDVGAIIAGMQAALGAIFETAEEGKLNG